MRHVPARIEQREQRRATDQQHAIRHGEPVGELAEAVRQVRVDRHVRHHAGTVDESRLPRHDEQQRFGQQSDQDERDTDSRPTAGEPVREHRVHRPAGSRRRVHQEIREDEPPGGDRQRHGHEGHRALPGLHLRLAHDGEPVRHRFDPRVGAAAQGVRAHEQRDHAGEAQAHGRCVNALAEPVPDLPEDGGDVAQAAEDHAADEDRVADQEGQEQRRQRDDGFLHASQVQEDEEPDSTELQQQLDGHAEHHRAGPCGRQEAEDGVARGGEGDGNRQHVVHDQGTSRHDAGAFPQQP